MKNAYYEIVRTLADMVTYVCCPPFPPLTHTSYELYVMMPFPNSFISNPQPCV